MKNIKWIILMAILLSALTGCKPSDTTNKNVELIEKSNGVKNINIYYDTTQTMTQYFSDPAFSEIVYAAASAAKDTWYEADCKLYKAGETIDEINQDFLTSSLSDIQMYSGGVDNVLKNVLLTLPSDGINIIMTDLGAQLSDYSAISNLLVHSSLEKEKAIAFIGIETDTKPFFIIAIGDNGNLSKYVETFKSNPSIAKYDRVPEDGVQIDLPQKINYQIIANKSGINGIKYDEISVIEKGKYLDDNGRFTLTDDNGSFEKLREDYKKSDLGKIEGTVNFTPNIPQFVNVKSIAEKREKTTASEDDKKKRTDSESNKNKSKNRRNIFLGAKSLVTDKKAETAGKIKLDIPFDIISGVKLSKLDCDVDLHTEYSTGSGFREQQFDGINVTIADGASPEQGKWRVDDKTNSIIFNINFDNAAVIPSEKGVIKMDITFKYYDSISTTSEWIKQWDGNKVNNLMNMFNSLYLYQKDANTSESSMTFYVGAGNKSLNNRAQREMNKNKGGQQNKKSKRG